MNNPQAVKIYNVSNTNAGKPHTYTTGTGGRVEKVEGELKLSTRDRNGYQQSVKCNTAKGGTAGMNQGGHLIGSRFDGAGEQIYLVPMKGALNTGAWKSMENAWATVLQQTPAKTVKVEIRPIYLGTGLKPIGFEIDSWIGGVMKPMKTFGNI